MPFLGQGSDSNIKQENANLPPMFSRWDAAKAAFELSSKDTLGEFYGMWNEVNKLKSTSEQMLTPQEANDLYPNMDQPFTRDIEKNVADYLAKQNLERRKLQARISSSPSDYLQTTINFASGLGAQMLDPAQLIGSALLGYGAVKIATKIPGLAKVAAGAGAAGSTTQNVTRAVGTEFIGNVAFEPIVATGSAIAQQRYTMQDAMTSVVAGTIAGSAIDLGIRGAVKLFRDQNSGLMADKLQAAKSQLDNDLRVKVDDYERSNLPDLPEEAFLPETPKGMERVSDTSSLPGIREYKKLEGVVGSKLYGGSRNKVNPTRSKIMTQAIASDNFIELTDNPRYYADEIVNSKNKSGSIGEYNLKQDLDLIDADVPYDMQSPAVKSFMEKTLGKKSGSLKQGLESVNLKNNEQVMNNLREVLNSEGKDGISFASLDRNGNKFNSAILSAQDKLELAKKFGIDPKKIKKNKKGKTDAIDYFTKGKDNKLFTTREDIELAESVPSKPQMDEEFDLDFGEVRPRDINPDNFKSESSKKMYNDAVEAFDNLETETEAIKAGFFCLNR